MVYRTTWILVCGCAVFALLSAHLITKGRARTDERQEVQETDPVVHRYVTWVGYEVDRFMAAWLIKRFLDPEAEFSFLPVGSEVPTEGCIAFDVPGGRWFRGGRRSTAEVIRAELEVEDPIVDRMVAMVRKLELGYWLVDPTSDVGRMNSDILRIVDRTPDSVERLDEVFTYFDGIYKAGGGSPERQ